MFLWRSPPLFKPLVASARFTKRRCNERLQTSLYDLVDSRAGVSPVFIFLRPIHRRIGSRDATRKWRQVEFVKTHAISFDFRSVFLTQWRREKSFENSPRDSQRAISNVICLSVRDNAPHKLRRRVELRAICSEPRCGARRSRKWKAGTRFKNARTGCCLFFGLVAAFNLRGV